MTKKAFTSSKFWEKMTIQKIQFRQIDRIQRKHNLRQKWGQKIGIKVDGIINEKPKNWKFLPIPIGGKWPFFGPKKIGIKVDGIIKGHFENPIFGPKKIGIKVDGIINGFFEKTGKMAIFGHFFPPLFQKTSIFEVWKILLK